jgi:6-phosphogluconate dehydrogenase
MHVGIIGLGRMGNGVARRLMRGGHTVVAFNRTFAKTEALATEGAIAAPSLRELVEKLPAPRVVWLYLPSGDVTREHLDELFGLLQPGDTIMDGGNSRFADSVVAAAEAEGKGMHWLDVGTSGGLGGETAGYCLMVGGENAHYSTLQSLWDAVAQPGGSVLAGPAGAGHYTKMVHNGIEYGILQAYAEGVALLQDGTMSGKIDLGAVANVWQKGSIIESRIGGWSAEALNDSQLLDAAKLDIDENGESRWTVQEAVEARVAVPVISSALFARFSSQGKHPIANKLTNAVRNLFGGHAL